MIGQGDRLHIIEDNVDNLAITVAKRTQDVVTANAYHKKRSFGQFLYCRQELTNGNASVVSWEGSQASGELSARFVRGRGHLTHELHDQTSAYEEQ